MSIASRLLTFAVGRTNLDPGTISGRAASFWAWSQRPELRRLVRAVADYVDADGTVVDVGANIGAFSRMLMARVGFRGAAHLFEPVPHLAELCQKRFADGRYAATLHRVALGDVEDTLPIYTSADGNIGWNTMVADAATPGMRRVDVPVRRYDDLGLPTPSFIKIDVEGAEHRVIRGMLGTLSSASQRPVILCEVGWGAGHPEWNLELEAFGRLADLGYRTTNLAGKEFDIRALHQTTDVLFLPST